MRTPQWATASPIGRQGPPSVVPCPGREWPCADCELCGGGGGGDGAGDGWGGGEKPEGAEGRRVLP